MNLPVNPGRSTPDARGPGQVVHLTYDEWVERFRPIPNLIAKNASFEIDGQGRMYETFGAEAEAVKKVANVNPCIVWTFMNGDVEASLCEKAGFRKQDDDGETEFFDEDDMRVDGDFIGDGYHYVNRIGYFITEIPAEEGVTYVIYLNDGLAEAAKSA